MDDGTRSDLLDKLEKGQLNVDQVIRALQAETPDRPSRERASRGSIRSWWWLLIAGPGAVMVLGGTLLVRLQGWWLVPAILLLLLGGLIISLGLMSIGSPWIRLRISSPESAPLRTLGFYLPLPLRPAAWIARVLGKRTPFLDSTVLDELLDAMGSTRDPELSFSIDVEDREGGERIQVSID